MDFISYILLSLVILIVLLQLLFVIKPLITVGKSGTYTYKDPTDIEETPTIPKATVICYVASADDDIDSFLDKLMHQTYSDYEVVLVYESVAETAAMIADRYAEQYPSLYVTFIPPGSHNLSRRKLALTLGMKAAKGEVVVTTATNIEIHSALWLETILYPFVNPETEVVLGYSRIKFSELKGLWRWYKEFDTMLTDASWIGYAYNYSPYRGDSNNMAFRRQLFFDNKGYASTINLQNGEDDLFVDEIANGYNTVMALDSDCILDTEWGSVANMVWTDNKARYDFTRQWLPKAPFIRSGISSAIQWIVPAMLAASAVIGWPSLIPLVLSSVILLSFWLVEILIYRGCAARMQVTKLWWSLPLFMMARPIVNFFFRMKHYKKRHRNYTWQREKNSFQAHHH